MSRNQKFNIPARRDDRKASKGRPVAEKRTIAWGEGKSVLLYVNARMAALLADQLPVLFQYLAAEKWPPDLSVPTDEWLKMYNRPERIGRKMVDNLSGVHPFLDGALPNGDGFSPYDGLMAFLRMNRTMAKRPVERRKRIIERFIRQIPPSTLREIWRGMQEEVNLLVQQHHLESEQCILNGTPELTSSEEAAIESPEGQFCMRVWMPLILLYKEWPHVLMRKARAGSLKAICRLVAVDKRVVADPEIAGHIAALSERKPQVHRRTVLKAMAYKIDEFQKKEIKVSTAAAIYEMFCKFPKPYMKASVESLRRLFNAIATAKGDDGFNRDDPSVPKPEAFKKGVEKARKQWRRFFDKSWENFSMAAFP